MAKQLAINFFHRYYTNFDHEKLYQFGNSGRFLLFYVFKLKCKHRPDDLAQNFYRMAAESSIYLSGDSLEEIYELLEVGFLDNHVDLNKELDAVTSTEEIDDKKKVFKCTMCRKECVSSRGLKRHTTLKHVQEEVIPKELKKKKCLSRKMNL